MKECKICHEIKPLDDYYSQNRTNKKGEHYIYYNPECKECTIKRSRQRILENHEEYIEYKRKWHYDNWDYQREEQRKWHYEHREHLSEYSKKYRRSENGKKKFKQYQEERKSKVHEISNEEWLTCKEYFSYSCAYCGMTYDEHKSRYGKDLHRDHVDPEGSNKIDNCVPACVSCNVKKRKYDLDWWYKPDNPVYDETRLSKINKWLQEDVHKINK